MVLIEVRDMIARRIKNTGNERQMADFFQVILNNDFLDKDGEDFYFCIFSPRLGTFFFCLPVEGGNFAELEHEYPGGMEFPYDFLNDFEPRCWAVKKEVAGPEDFEDKIISLLAPDFFLEKEPGECSRIEIHNVEILRGMSEETTINFDDLDKVVSAAITQTFPELESSQDFSSPAV